MIILVKPCDPTIYAKFPHFEIKRNITECVTIVIYIEVVNFTLVKFGSIFHLHMGFGCDFRPKLG